jgi:hypothetical protein
MIIEQWYYLIQVLAVGEIEMRTGNISKLCGGLLQSVVLISVYGC